MDSAKFSNIRNQFNSVVISVCLAAFLLFVTANICAWLFDRYLAPALVSASQKMALGMNWEAFWSVMISVVTLAILAIGIIVITKAPKNNSKSVG